MPQKKTYSTIKELAARISAKADDMENGRCDLQEMDVLLQELRELEERVIIIRFKAMEKLRLPKKKKPKSILAINEPQLAPELPLDIPNPPIVSEPEIAIEPAAISEIAAEATPEIGELDTAELIEDSELIEEIPENQISLIDSIEEISKESSINERMQRKTKKSLAQTLEGKSVTSVMKALNLNQKLGMIQTLFGGDEDLFKTTIVNIDEAESLESAEEIYAAAIPVEMQGKEPIARKLENLIKRRFS